MSRRYRRSRQSPAGQIVGDVAYIANRLPWQWTLGLGAVLFIAFYWGVPALISWHTESTGDNISRAMLEAMLGRRSHWAQWIAIAIVLVCSFFAAWNAWTSCRLDRTGENNTGFISRLLARWID